MVRKTGGKQLRRSRQLAGNFEFTGALLLAALLQAQGAHAEGLDARTILAKLTDQSQLTPEEAQLLHLAVAIEAPETLTQAELAAILSPDALIALGLTPEFVAELLNNDTAEVLRQLKQAFAPKLKAALASAEHKIFADDPHFKHAAAQSESGGDAGGDSAAPESGGSFFDGISPLAILGGAVGIGAIGLAISQDDDSAQAPVNRAPTATDDAVTTEEDSSVVIDVLANDTDLDGDTLTITHINGTAISTATPVTITIDGVTAGTVTLNANGTLTFTPAADYSGTPSFDYTISDGKGGTDTGTVNLTVAKLQTGVVSDGYIANGTVFIDVDGNGKFDPGEPTAATDGNGKFTIASNLTGAIIAFGGTNTDTGLPNNVTMTAPVGSTVVNPLTTIVQSLVKGGATVAEANASVTAAFGLPADTNLPTYDILAHPGDATALAAQKAAAQIVTFLNVAREAAGDASASVESAIIAKIAAAAGGGAPPDLSSTTAVSSLLTGVQGIPQSAVNTVVAKAASINQLIATANDLGGIAEKIVETSKATNLAPATGTDAVSTTRGTSKTFDVRTNDADPDGDPLSVTKINGTAISTTSPVAIDGIGTVSLNADGTLTFTPTPTFIGTPSFTYTISDGKGGTATGTVNLTVSVPPTTLSVSAADFASINPAALAAQGTTEIDIGGANNIGNLTISQPQATALIDAGIRFAAEDNITLSTAAGPNAGTHLSTSLTQLQALGVDSVAVANGVAHLSIDVGAGGLAALSPASLPQFDVAQSDAALDVTLNIGTGNPFAGVGEFANLVSGLAAAGIDHLDIGGANTVGSLSITEAQAGAMVATGLDFAHNDIITLTGAGAAGTHLSTSLTQLQALGVDSVAVANGVHGINLDVGAGGLAGLSLSNMPQFDEAQSDDALDVTLNIGAGDIAAVSNLQATASILADAGIDHLDISGAGVIGSATISDVQAEQLVSAGLDFAHSDNITVAAAGTHLATSLVALQALGVDSVEAAPGIDHHLTVEVGDGGLHALANGGALPHFADALDVTLQIDPTADNDLSQTQLLELATNLHATGVDHLDIGGATFAGDLELSDFEASAFVATGLDFAANDHVVVTGVGDTSGTHLSTSLHDLQHLGVDSVAVADGVHSITVDLGAGGIDGLHHLPQFDEAQSDDALDVTLEVGSDATVDTADLGTLLGVNLLQGLTTPDLYGDLIQALEEAGIDRIEITASNRVEVADGLAAVLDELDSFDAGHSDLVLNATGSGDHLLTTLHEMGDLGVDHVEVADQGSDPVYVDLGDVPLSVDGLQALLDGLDSDQNPATHLFTGTQGVSLVVDQTAAETLAQVDHAAEKLAALGFTEVTVLDGVNGSFVGALEAGNLLDVKLIGQDDPLYDHLHNH